MDEITKDDDGLFMFGGELEMEKELEETIGEVIDIDAEFKEIKEEPEQLEASKEETPVDEKKSGIDFAKRMKGAKEEVKESPAKEPENVESPAKEEEIPQSDVTYQADIKMTTTVKDERAGTEEEEEEILATVQFPDVPSKVFFKKGLTRNLGNFESYRVDVGIEMPCSTKDLTRYVLEGGKVVEHRLALEIQKAQRLYGNAGGSVFDKVNVNL